MKNKLKVNTVWSVIIIVLFAAGVYYLLYSNKEKNVKIQINNENETIDVSNSEIKPANTTNNITNSGYDWNSISEPELNSVIVRDGDLYDRLKLSYNEDVNLDIANKKEVDLTDNTQKDLLIGRTGAWANLYFILTRNNEGVISVAKQKDKNGKISSILLGGGYGPDISSTYELLPEEHGYYIINIIIKDPVSGYGQADYSCSNDSINAYTWSPTQKLFEWNKTLSNKYFLYVEKKYNIDCSK